MEWINLILGLGVIALIIVQFVKFKLMRKIIASFDNSTDGFSARKLSAFAGVIVSVIATFRFVDAATIVEALMVWLVFALLCLGIITAEQLLKFYSRGKATEETTTTTESMTTSESTKTTESSAVDETTTEVTNEPK
jgi:hypothetical protein